MPWKRRPFWVLSGWVFTNPFAGGDENARGFRLKHSEAQ